MPLPEAHIREMTKSISVEWIRIQCMICAHKRRRDWNELLSGTLNWATVVTAIATAASTALEGYHWLTVATGVLTAALAAAERVFAPNKNIQNLWKAQRSLETVQHELPTLLFSLVDMKTIAEAQKALNRISENAADAISIPVAEKQKDREEAQREFEGSVLYSRLAETTDAVIGDDAPDVIEFSRRRRV